MAKTKYNQFDECNMNFGRNGGISEEPNKKNDFVLKIISLQEMHVAKIYLFISFDLYWFILSDLMMCMAISWPFQNTFLFASDNSDRLLHLAASH